MIRRTAMKKSTRRKGDRPGMRRHYIDRRDRCELCHARKDSFTLSMRAGLEPHHIVGGSNRIDSDQNIIALCPRCHDHYHDGGGRDSTGARLPEVTRGAIIAAKLESLSGPTERAECINALLMLAHRRGLPESWGAAVVPQAFVNERKRNLI